MELAYSRLSLAEQMRADRGTFIGISISIVLGLLFHSANLQSILSTASSWIIPGAFAQAAGGRATQVVPSFIAYIIYLVLLALLLASFYLGALKGSPSTYVRDTWKTLLGFFIGIVTR